MVEITEMTEDKGGDEINEQSGTTDKKTDEKIPQDATASKDGKEVAKAKEPPPNVMLFLVVGLIVAMIGAPLQIPEVASGMEGAQNFAKTFFDPHVVPPPKAAKNEPMLLLSNFIGMLQYEAMFALFLNDKILPQEMRENKVMVFFGIWFGGSMFSSAMTKTSAFEIYLGRKLVWSSLRNQRTPQLQDLKDGFKAVGVKLDA